MDRTKPTPNARSTPSARRAAFLALSLSGALSAGVLVGCEARDLPTESDLQLRADAADRITAPADRDQEMAKVAAEAADQGDVGVVNRELKSISNRNARNQAAADCAVRLVKAGQRADGNKVAATITDPAVRNDTFKRLADSEPGSTDPAAKGVKNYLGD